MSVYESAERAGTAGPDAEKVALEARVRTLEEALGSAAAALCELQGCTVDPRGSDIVRTALAAARRAVEGGKE